MSLNELNLSAGTLANLYPNTLVIPGDTIPSALSPSPSFDAPRKTIDQHDPIISADEAPGKEWKYLGNNGKNIVIIVRHEDAVHLPDEELSFLTNMLTACKLSLADVAIVNFERHQEKSYKDFIEEFNARTILLFGITPAAFNLPVNFPAFQVQELGNCTFLHTPGLNLMREDALLKSKLWVCLRTVFNI